MRFVDTNVLLYAASILPEEVGVKTDDGPVELECRGEAAVRSAPGDLHLRPQLDLGDCRRSGAAGPARGFGSARRRAPASAQDPFPGQGEERGAAGEAFWFLHWDGRLYLFKTEPSLEKVVQDEACSLNLATGSRPEPPDLVRKLFAHAGTTESHRTF